MKSQRSFGGSSFLSLLEAKSSKKIILKRMTLETKRQPSLTKSKYLTKQKNIYSIGLEQQITSEDDNLISGLKPYQDEKFIHSKFPSYMHFACFYLTCN